MSFKIFVFVIFVCFFVVQCGRVRRVVGGTVVDCGVQPRVVSLRKINDMKHLCGATLLSPEVAVTAAHCVKNDSPYYLKLINFCTEDSPIAVVLALVKHEQYDMYSRAHDIALLRIKLYINDTNWLDNSILPRSSFGLSGECSIYGYGYEHVHSEETSDQLRAGVVNTTSLDDCTERLGSVAPQYDAGLMCAMGDGVDACQGDSGGPLLCNDLLEGISSHGMSCATPGIPGVYTSVAAHLPWIHNNMQLLEMH